MLLIYEVVGLQAADVAEVTSTPRGKTDGSMEVKMGSVCVYPFPQPRGRWWFLTYETWGSDIERISLISSPFERSIHHVFVVEKSGMGSGYSNEGRILFFERTFSCCFSRKILQPPFFFGWGESSLESIKEILPRFIFFPKDFAKVKHLELT